MIYFVTEKFIKDKTHITQNVDATQLAPYIPIAAESYVKPILGYTFFNDLLTKYNAGTLNADETELVDIMQYVVAFWAAYVAVPNITFSIRGKGIQSQYGDYSAQETIATVEYIRNNIQHFATIKENELRGWLELNKDKFSLYTDAQNKDITPPDEDRYSGTNLSFI